MDREYLALLSDVKSATIEHGQLIIYASESNTMFFKNGELAEQ